MAQHYKTTIRRATKIRRTPRVIQMLGKFDVPPAAESIQTWQVDFTLPEAWNIGVIVGKSGDGKTTIATECFGLKPAHRYAWDPERSLLDSFPAAMKMDEIVGLLSSVGFSSPPAWLRPFHVLSNGEQFRVTLARTIAESGAEMAIVDEFTSVVDRTVAQIGSAAVAKTIRRRGGRFVAVTCHYDVLDWLEPDWVYEPATNKLTLNQEKKAHGSPSVGVRWCRPPIDLKIIRTDRTAWPLFAGHHYLSHGLHKSAACFVALVKGQPAAFTAVLSFPHPVKPAWREHRTVCLPDFQGVGIGNAMSEAIAGLYRATGKPYQSTTSHPAMIRHRMKSPLWKTLRAPSMVTGKVGPNTTQQTGMNATLSSDRITAGFEYIGPPRPDAARSFGLPV